MTSTEIKRDRQIFFIYGHPTTIEERLEADRRSIAGGVAGAEAQMDRLNHELDQWAEVLKLRKAELAAWDARFPS